MSLDELYFWEVLTNTFQPYCGMVTPTLFDVAVITGLRATNEVFNPTIQKQNNIGFNSKCASFTNLIFDHFDKTIKEFFDEEHIVFLYLWLSHFVFCCSYLQVAKSFITLAN